MQSLRRKAVEVIVLGLVCLPAALLALAFVVHYSLDVPVGDQWYDPIHVVVKSHTNQLSIRDLFVMAEGHRPLTIRLIAIAASYANHLDPRAMSLTAWFCSWINLILIYILLLRDPLFSRPRSRGIEIGAMFVFASIGFTIHDQEGWIDYYFSTWQIALLFFLVACICVQRLRGFLALSAAVIFCSLSTLSLGIGLSSWIAIPVVAAGYKKHRKASFLVAWVGFSGLAIWLYQSRFAASSGDANSGKLANLSSLAFGGDGGLASVVSRSLKVIVYSLSRLWLPAESWDHSWVPKIIIAFTALSVLAVICICLSFLQAGHIRSSSTWAGLAFYSLTGAFLVYLSRRNLMPELRHSAGVQAFWVACASLMILYVVNFFAGKGISGLGLKFGYATPLIRGALADKILIPLSIGSIVLLPVLSLAKTVSEFTRPPKFPAACSLKTKHFALLKDSSLRDCFAFIDVRSVYQLSLLSLGGLNVTTIQVPIIQHHGTLITALPGDLLSAYIIQALLSSAQSAKPEGKDTNLHVLSLSIKDAQPSNAFPSPLAASMDWSGSGMSSKVSHVFASVDAINEYLASSMSKKDFIYVAYTVETLPESEQIKAMLAARGMRVIQAAQIADANDSARGIFIECHTAHSEKSFSSTSAQRFPAPARSKQCFEGRRY